MADTAYLDTSAFIKRYLNEPGTRKMEAFAASTNHRLAISSLTITEFRSVFRRLVRDGAVQGDFARAVTAQLLKEIAGGALRFHAVEAATFNLAGELIERLDSPLATLDAIHLACAQASGAALMVSADKQLLRAAAESGFETLDMSEEAPAA